MGVGKKRLACIDVLRGIAILLMIQVHFVENLSYAEPSTALLRTVSFMLGTISAPIFTFLVGLSLWLWLDRAVSSGAAPSVIARTTIRRGVLVFVAGLIFAVAIWLPGEVFDWDILTLIGAATIILYLLRGWSARALLLLVALVLLMSPPLRAATGYAEQWDDYYIYEFTVRDISLGFLLQGYFPLLPWLSFPLLGFATGKYFFAEGPDLTPLNRPSRYASIRLANKGGQGWAKGSMLRK